MTKFQIEILLKNVFLVALSVWFYPIVESSFSIAAGKDILDTLVLFVGLIIVVPLFANFAFTYEFVNVASFFQRYTGHLIAFVIMLSTFLLLIMLDVLFIMAVGDIWVFRFILALFAIAILLYDFWDAARNKENSL